MTKYYVFRNQTDGVQKNVPGSREEIACEIATVVGQDNLPKDFFIAYAHETKHECMETMRELAKCTIEINDDLEKLWVNEGRDLFSSLVNLDDQIEEACSSMYGAALEVDKFVSSSEHFQDLEYLNIKEVDRTFEYINSSGLSHFIDSIEEIYEVEFFHTQNA